MIATADLVLRQWRADDLPALAALYADPLFSWFPYRRARTAAEAAQFLDSTRSHWREYGIGRWAVCDRPTGALLGYAGVTTLTWPVRPSAWDLGFRLATAARGRGLGLQAGSAAVAHALAFSPFDLVATADVDHTACRSLLGKLGLIEVGLVTHPEHGTPHIVAELRRDDPA